MMQILDNAKKKKIIEKISCLGIKKIPYLLIKTGKERVRALSGSLSNEELSKIVLLLSVEGAGIYFGKEQEDGSFRLSIDALHLLKNQITSFVEINEDQEKEWFLGKNVELNEEQQKKYADFKGFIAVKGGEDFIGTGKISQDKKMISNFLPKERTIKQNFQQ